MKVIIAGSRKITDVRFVEHAVKLSGFSIREVVSGGAAGVDKLAETWAKDNKIPVRRFLANWKDITVKGAVIRTGQYGKYNAVAGHMRNGEMAAYGQALIAIWDGHSRGTKDMIDKSVQSGLEVFVYRVDLARRKFTTQRW